MAMKVNFMIPSPNCYQFDVQGLTFYVQKEKVWNIEEKCIKHIFPYADPSRPIEVDNVSAKSFEHFLRLTHGGRARLTEQNLLDLFILSVKYDAMHLYAKLHVVLSNTNTINVIKKLAIHGRFPFLPAPKTVRRSSKENQSPKKMIAQILKNWNQR